MSLIEDYVIDKGDILSIQCTVSLRRPKSVRKVDDLSLMFIGFYVPAFTPRLNSSETSLQLSENITTFAVCDMYTDVISKEAWIDRRCLGRIIYIYMLYSVGDMTEPCGTPACISLGVGISPSTKTLNFLWEGKELISLIRLLENSVSQLYYDRRSVGQSLLVSRPDFYCVWPLRFFDMGRPLWREDGSVFYIVQCTIYNTFYCLRFETAPTWGTRSLYLYPPGTGWPGYTPRHWVTPDCLLHQVPANTFSLYILGSDPVENNSIVQQRISFCCHTRLSGKVFIALCIARSTARIHREHCCYFCVFVGTCLLHPTEANAIWSRDHSTVCTLHLENNYIRGGSPTETYGTTGEWI
jgi:hypothetical protein